jgi:hypothetical protein
MLRHGVAPPVNAYRDPAGTQAGSLAGLGWEAPRNLCPQGGTGLTRPPDRTQPRPHWTGFRGRRSSAPGHAGWLGQRHAGPQNPVRVFHRADRIERDGNLPSVTRGNDTDEGRIPGRGNRRSTRRVQPCRCVDQSDHPADAGSGNEQWFTLNGTRGCIRPMDAPANHSLYAGPPPRWVIRATMSNGIT